MANGNARVRVTREFMHGWAGFMEPENFDEDLRYSEEHSVEQSDRDLFLSGADHVHFVRPRGVAVFRRFKSTATYLARQVTSPVEEIQKRQVIVYEYEFVEWRPLPRFTEKPQPLL